MTRACVYSIVAGLVIASGPPCLGQQAAQSGNAADSLESPDPRARARAFEALRQRRGALAAPPMALQLMTLLRREDDLMASVLRESQGATAVADKYGEGWGEYYANLFDACFAYCDRQAFLDEFLRGERSDRVEVRNDAVRVMGELALPNKGFTDSQRTVMESRLLAAARDTSVANVGVRRSSIRLLGDLFRADQRLPQTVRAQIHDVVVGAAKDPSPQVRWQAARSLGDVGKASDLPLLEQLAETDTSRSVLRGKTVFPVRDEAMQAIGKIKP